MHHKQIKLHRTQEKPDQLTIKESFTTLLGLVASVDLDQAAQNMHPDV